jgi:hypothetical protein
MFQKSDGGTLDDRKFLLKLAVIFFNLENQWLGAITDKNRKTSLRAAFSNANKHFRLKPANRCMNWFGCSNSHSYDIDVVRVIVNVTEVFLKLAKKSKSSSYKGEISVQTPGLTNDNVVESNSNILDLMKYNESSDEQFWYAVYDNVQSVLFNATRLYTQ